ncbi:mitochondrial ribosome-associated GTPase 2 isoform X2 [Homalodisca vitripennis]|uniref:mitochondrial ribosome-associated GTPase 2 isoform X2 n=1 Tax=Homalodisca vitripennis TaxID=197043 RepID=UPI001EEBBEF7|nr:mitochondrial ribosome-associated GTPase 2 isoform X2 [Homalodisca vitripennis]XP_046676948.1 mitochondrial ribosome-associated GTPase 2 isoform X2 [Homalodisca vitripennis]
MLQRLSNVSVKLIRYCSSKPTAVPLRSKKPKSKSAMVQSFDDMKSVRVIGGKGGDGCVSFLQLYANDKAGPDGGDGGNGGHVIFLASRNVASLNHITPELKGLSGEKGYNKDCHGKNASHTIVEVPVGTIVKDQNLRVVGDLDRDGAMFVAARGGAGGHGNTFFCSDTTQSPEVAEYGALGENLSYVIEIRSMAHFGLLGMPNAGKSTLLQAISRARPKIAPYPFTTLKPHLGVVQYSDYEQIAVADLPGLIEGSHKNRGLGISFLRHVERCAALLLLVDVSGPTPWQDVQMLRHELSCFSEPLSQRPQLILANKIDVPGSQDNVEALKEHLPGETILCISAKFGTNLLALLNLLRSIYDESMKNKMQDKL